MLLILRWRQVMLLVISQRTSATGSVMQLRTRRIGSAAYLIDCSVPWYNSINKLLPKCMRMLVCVNFCITQWVHFQDLVILPTCKVCIVLRDNTFHIFSVSVLRSFADV